MKSSTKKVLGIIGGIFGAGGLIGLIYYLTRKVTPYIPSCSDCDLNGDGWITISDRTILYAHWGETGLPGWIKADVNRDGVIDEKDRDWLYYYWGQQC